ncbi:MAG: ImmA/IrrE family metallo-endopeptidase [Erysipelotrichaceae bacterium]
MTLRIERTGEIIKEYLDANNITQKELHVRTGLSERHISKVLNGNARLTEGFALKLEKIITDVSASYWLNYEAKYREQIARDKEMMSLGDRDLEIIKKRFLFSEVFGGLGLSIREQACEMLKLLKISDFSLFESTYQNLEVDFMEDGGSMESIVIWLKLCEADIEIQNQNVGEYSCDNLKKMLDKFRKIALNDNVTNSINSARKLCNSLGINLVICEAVKKSKIRGALTEYKNNPTIYLSGRFKTHDHIWFALMHEIGHLLLHYDSKSIMVSLEEERIESSREKEANKFAHNYFIDEDAYNSYKQNMPINEESLRKFARQQEILPGIVVARLRHDGVISYNQFSYMINYINVE